jgi:hypothetical protein
MTAVNDLSNFDTYHEDILFAVFKMLAKMMTKLSEIPLNSILRQNKHDLIQEIYQKIFYTVRTMLKGIIAEQNYQKNILHKRQKIR